MKVTNHILLIFVVIQLSFFCGCKTLQNTPIEGEYKYSGSMLILNSDRTFEFDWQEGLISTNIQGNFSVKGNNLYLNADPKSNRKNFEIKIPPQTKRSNFELVVQDQYRNKLIGAICLLTKSDELIEGATTDEEGICILPYDETGHITIRSLGYETAKINLDDISVHSLIVQMKREDYYEQFNNLKMIIRNGKIIDTESKPKWRFVKNETK